MLTYGNARQEEKIKKPETKNVLRIQRVLLRIRINRFEQSFLINRVRRIRNEDMLRYNE